jgi:hypothetical protein
MDSNNQQFKGQQHYNINTINAVHTGACADVFRGRGSAMTTAAVVAQPALYLHITYPATTVHTNAARSSYVYLQQTPRATTNHLLIMASTLGG